MDITTLLSDLSSVVHGTTTNKVPNIYGIINRAARAVLLDVDPKETQRITQLNQVFNDVFDYPAPVDLKGDSFVDLRPQAGRNPGDIFQQNYAENFDAQKLLGLSNKVYTQWNSGVKTLRIEAPTLTAPVQLTDTGSTTGWSATTGAASISLDQTFNVAGGGAIVFNLLAGSSSGYIENSTLTPIDLSAQENISYLFAWVYMPAGTSITSVDMRWGSSSTNYWHSTQTTTQQATSFQNGWNLIQFPWSTATSVGSPDSSALSYVRLTLAYDSTLQTGVKFCNPTSNLGAIFELQYYSKYLFRNPSTSAFVEKVLDSTYNTYLINLDTDSYNLLFNKCAFYIAQALQGADAEYDAAYWDSEYQNALKIYKGRNPSEKKLKGTTYYQLPNKSYSKYNPGTNTIISN